jgi:GAF domain-containing protein
MKRRSRAGGGLTKGRRRKKAKPISRNTPKVVARSNSSHSSEETEVTRLTLKLNEALEQQTATSEVLRVISSSPGDLQPVFAAMLENAVRICDATFGNIFRWDGEAFQLMAAHKTPPAFAKARKISPIRPTATTLFGRLVTTKSLVHTPDLAAEKQYVEERRPSYVEAVELGGIRAFLVVPMLKNDELIGAIGLFRHEVRPFADRQIELVKGFAAQAVIAIENARLLSELRQSLEQQTATADVLKVISSSLGSLEPVFIALLTNATRLCGASYGNLWLCEGDAFRSVALVGELPPSYVERWGTGAVFRPGPDVPLAKATRTKQPYQIPDIRASKPYREGNPLALSGVDEAGILAVLAVPLLKEGDVIGAILIYSKEARPFTEKQVELLENFAAQAVIAIENARLLNELRQRTTDLSEALEQQTATSEVLQVISKSPSDLEPVFSTMLEKAVRICGASFGNIYRWGDEGLSIIASCNTVAAFVEQRRQEPFRPSRINPVGQMIASKKTVHVHNMAETEAYLSGDPVAVASVEIAGARTGLAVPILKENNLIGAFTLGRQEIRDFSEREIALIVSFANQAVIAIENARLLNELRQSLEQQTAASEVLDVISRSPGELQPVFRTILENASRLCEANFGILNLYDNGNFPVVAMHNVPDAFAQWRRREPLVQPGSTHVLARVEATKRLLHVIDLKTEAAYIAKEPPFLALVDGGGARTLLIVPMLKNDQLLGTVSIYRQEVRAFTEKQIALLENFGAQAVIAIENTRLLKELRERTAEVEKLNEHLEQRVTEQVDEIERMSRLRRFLPPQVADLIVASGSEKQLESHRREITALFCDLRGFTGFTESADAEDVMALLRDYHAAIGELVIKYSGTLERYAGDGVMVIFNDPVPVENPALQAVLMALEVRDAIGALTEKWRRWGHEIGFGVGIAHGFATLGTIGFEGRFDYAAIGTVSNVASRLCDEAKPGQILISPRVLTKVENAVTVELVGEFELKGSRRPLAAYNVVAASPSGV